MTNYYKPLQTITIHDKPQIMTNYNKLLKTLTNYNILIQTMTNYNKFKKKT